jgi:ankyrin repeat protein
METLRRCFPPSIRQILSELPRTLDETYERILLKIDEEKRAYAHRLFQWLVVSIRPLRVEELAELFAVLPGAESKSGFNIGWRPEDPEEFILSACSTLVAIVDVRGRKVAQFSHFSAREYLTSDRIANSAHVSHFHIHLKSAHTVLARTCLNALLQLDYSIDKTKIQSFPLAWYAAEHWVDHARYEGVSSDIQYEMDCLFDRKTPHFAAWNWLHNVDGSQNRYLLSTCPTWPDAGPLYCSALCGFRDLAERLLTAYPHDANARGGHHETALYAAFINGYLDIVLLLLERGADAEFRGRHSQTLLYMASSRGYAEVVRSLIDHRADLNSVCDDIEGICTNVKRTPLLVASRNDRQEVARVLLGHSADVNYQDNFGRSPLHLVLCHPSNNLVRLLLDHNANPNALDIWGNTALHDASSYGHTITVMLLFEYGAHVDAQNKRGWTPLHEAAREGHLEVVQVLLDHGAESNTQKIDGWTPLHLAAYYGYFQVVDILLKRGADPDSRTGEGKTPFQLSLVCNHTRIAQMLSECTGPGNEMDVEIGLTE